MKTFTHPLSFAALGFCALTSVTSPAHAFKVLFYDVRPAEKLMDLPSLSGSRTVTPDEFAKMDAIDLLEFDMVYVDITATDMAKLAAQQGTLKDAVAAGLGLYLQGDLAAFAAAPVAAPASSSVAILSFDIPLQAREHALVVDAELDADDFGDAWNAAGRGFVGTPDGFTVIAEAISEQGNRFPVLIAGAWGYGRVVLRTHHFTDPDAYGIQKVDSAVIAWLTSNEDAPRKEPLQWLVTNYPKHKRPLVAAVPGGLAPIEVDMATPSPQEQAANAIASIGEISDTYLKVRRALPVPTASVSAR